MTKKQNIYELLNDFEEFLRNEYSHRTYQSAHLKLIHMFLDGENNIAVYIAIENIIRDAKIKNRMNRRTRSKLIAQKAER